MTHEAINVKLSTIFLTCGVCSIGVYINKFRDVDRELAYKVVLESTSR